MQFFARNIKLTFTAMKFPTNSLFKQVKKTKQNKQTKLGISLCIIANFRSVSEKLQAFMLTLKVLVTTIDAQWEVMGDVGLARYEPALLPPMPDHKGFKLQ